MLKLDRHLSEDELLALRDQRDHDVTRRDHLQYCARCQKRFAFLSAFKSALKDVVEEESSPRVMLSSIRRSPSRRASLPEVPRISSADVESWSSMKESRSESNTFADYSYAPAPDVFRESLSDANYAPSRLGPHPEPEALAAYFDGALEEYERTRVHKHLVDCERCMADLLVLFPSKEGPGVEEIRAAREYFQSHGSVVAYRPGSPRITRPQLVLGFEDGPRTSVLFRVLGRPRGSGRMGPGHDRLETQVEVMVGTVRVTVTARRKNQIRQLEVLVRDFGLQPPAKAAAVSLEVDGLPIASVRTGRTGKASLPVPDAPSFDLRIDGGWTVPVLLSFRS